MYTRKDSLLASIRKGRNGSYKSIQVGITELFFYVLLIIFKGLKGRIRSIMKTLKPAAATATAAPVLPPPIMKLSYGVSLSSDTHMDSCYLISPPGEKWFSRLEYEVLHGMNRLTFTVKSHASYGPNGFLYFALRVPGKFVFGQTGIPLQLDIQFEKEDTLYNFYVSTRQFTEEDVKQQFPDFADYDVGEEDEDDCKMEPTTNPFQLATVYSELRDCRVLVKMELDANNCCRIRYPLLTDIQVSDFDTSIRLPENLVWADESYICCADKLIKFNGCLRL